MPVPQKTRPALFKKFFVLAKAFFNGGSTIAGLWAPGAGAIDRPVHNRLIFLPQNPCMVPGNLRAQLVYPLNEEERRHQRKHAASQRRRGSGQPRFMTRFSTR